MLDCRSTQALLQRYVTGARVADGELDRALGHVTGCEACRRRLPALADRAAADPESAARAEAAAGLGELDPRL